MPVTARNQPPLPIELRPERPARLSQTWLTHYQRCKHSAYLYLKYKGSTSSHVMDRGSLFHEVVARLTNEAIENGWREVPHEMAKAALFEVYAEGEFTVPASEWDHVRRCVFNWAENFTIEVDRILGVEQLVVWDVGDWRISGKLDLCWQNGDTVGIRDWKTAMHPQTKEEFASSFQTIVYSLLTAYGKPVTVSDCECQGTGKLLVDMGDSIVPCEFCGGKGYQETVEPFALGEGAHHFDIAEVYPGLVFDEGGLMERRRVMSRRELVDERSMLEALLEQVTKSFDEGAWPAVPSDDACGKCPARRDCPLPPVLLPFDGIETQEEAEHFALAMDLLDAERKQIVKSLKAWVKNKDGSPRPIDLGNGTQLAFVKQEVNETDYEGFKQAQAEGRVVDLDTYKSKRIQTRFTAEPIPEQEQTADERWGVTIPDFEDSSTPTPSIPPQASPRAEIGLSEGKDEAA